MLKLMVLYGNDGEKPKVLPFDVPSKEFDLKKAIREAALEYAETKEGREALYGRESLDLYGFAQTVPDFFCRKHGFWKADKVACSMHADGECRILQKEEMPKGMPAKEADGEPEMKICSVGAEFGRIWGVMESLGFLKGRDFNLAALWAMEYLGCREGSVFDFFERKMKEYKR